MSFTITPFINKLVCFFSFSYKGIMIFVRVSIPPFNLL